MIPRIWEGIGEGIGEGFGFGLRVRVHQRGPPDQMALRWHSDGTQMALRWLTREDRPVEGCGVVLHA